MKILKLTSIAKVLTKEAEDRLSEIYFEEPKCSNGKTRSWYEDMNIKVPQEILDIENEMDEFEDEDFEIVTKQFRLPIASEPNFFYISVDEEDENDGANTVVFIPPQYTMRVTQTVEEIDELIINL